MSSRILLDNAAPGEREPPPPAPAEPREPAAPPAAERSEEAPAAPGEGAAGASEQPTPEDERTLAQKRIEQLTREKHTAIREAERLRTEWQRLQESQRPPPQPGQPNPQQYQRDVQQGVANVAFAQACNGVYQRGRDEYGQGMDDAVSALTSIGYGDITGDQVNPAAYVAMTEIADSPNGHRLYRELAADLDNAARILRLPPNAIIRELAKMEARLGANNGAAEPRGETPRTQVSRAPEPVRHIGGRTSSAPNVNLSDPNTDMATWIRERDRQERRSRISR